MIRGWCPTIHAPMPSGDGLLARVKPFGGRLPAAALAALAHAAATYANGIVELTSRGNIQIRGVHAPAAFAQAILAAGLADPDPDREARRNVTPHPGCDDTLVADAEALLANTPGHPPKVGVVVRGSSILLDGTAFASAADFGRWLSLATKPPSCPGLARVSTLSGAGQSACAPDRPTLPEPGHGSQHLLYLPLGQTDATTLAHLATLAREIRTTPYRAFLSPVPAPGFSTEPNTLTACPGGPACSSGTVPARADAARLQAAGFTNLHISGCAKGCAYPRPATTLTGRNGRYDLIRHGRAADRPDLTGLTLDQAMAVL